MGHPQPQTPVHCNNATTTGIANNTVKWQQSRSMEMRYFWVGDKVIQDAYEIKWHSGQENLADYQSKHHISSHHQAIYPWYLQEINSPMVIPRATRPSTLKGCVGNLPEGYIRRTEQLRKLGKLQKYYLDKFNQIGVFICRKQWLHYSVAVKTAERGRSPSWSLILPGK